MIQIARNPFVINSIIVIPTAIQNRMNPIILFISSLPISCVIIMYMLIFEELFHSFSLVLNYIIEFEKIVFLFSEKKGII